MGAQVPEDIEPLLCDNAWFARITRALASGDEEGVESPNRPLHPLPGASLDEAVSLTETRRDILDALLALKEPWRATVAFRFLEGWPIARVARLTRAPQGTVRRRVRRGLQWMRAVLHASEGTDEVVR